MIPNNERVFLAGEIFEAKIDEVRQSRRVSHINFARSSHNIDGTVLDMEDCAVGEIAETKKIGIGIAGSTIHEHHKLRVVRLSHLL